MKNGKIFLLLALSGAALFGCQKESSLSDLAANSQPYVMSVIKFSVGEKTYELSAVREETVYDNNNNNCAGAGCGNSTAKDFSDNWTTYSASAGNLMSVTRQDDTGKPAYRLTLSGIVDLRSTAFPANVANARITLNDFNGALIQPNDDPAYSTGTLFFQGSQDAVHLTVTSRTGNVVEGTFGGILKMANGSALEIHDGTFTAQLSGL
ncbi:MAG TPA: hypothetical protein PK228_00890 [Saprospiraceae bacterium]|nr:hypothetical protein [Saprospiraceae bacterium]